MQWALLQISVWRVVVKFTKKGNVNLVFDAKPSIGVSLCYDNILKKKIKSRVLSEPFRQKSRQFSNIVFLFERLIIEKLSTGYINY